MRDREQTEPARNVYRFQPVRWSVMDRLQRIEFHERELHFALPAAGLIISALDPDGAGPVLNITDQFVPSVE